MDDIGVIEMQFMSWGMYKGMTANENEINLSVWNLNNKNYDEQKRLI